MRTYQAYNFPIGIPVWVDQIKRYTQTGILNGLALIDQNNKRLKNVDFVETARHADAWKIGHKNYCWVGKGSLRSTDKIKILTLHRTERSSIKKESKKSVKIFGIILFESNYNKYFESNSFSNTISKYINYIRTYSIL